MSTEDFHWLGNMSESLEQLKNKDLFYQSYQTIQLSTIIDSVSLLTLCVEVILLTYFTYNEQQFCNSTLQLHL